MREGTNGITPLPGGLKPPLPNDDATRSLLDSQIGDAGSFTTHTVEQCRKALNQQVVKPILCLRDLWSSEHHHLGAPWLRADCWIDSAPSWPNTISEPVIVSSSKPTARPDSCLRWRPICSARHRSRDERRSSNCSLPRSRKVRTRRPFTASIQC